MDTLWPTAIGVGSLVGITVGVLTLARVSFRGAAAVAVLRAAVQLAAIGVVLSGVITSPWWVALTLVVMFSVAVWTSARRIGGQRRTLGLVAGAMAAGVVVTLSVVFLTRAIEFSPRYALAIGGIVIGGAMTVSTLCGRRIARATAERWPEVEGWLAVGGTARQATVDIARDAVREALIPSTDQTRTTGLVTLPGAFVGAIFGGLSPLEAGRFQVVVLAGILCAGVITATLVARWLAPSLHRRVE